MILFINSNEIWSRLYLLDVYIKTRDTFNVDNLRERSWCIQNVNRILLYFFWRLLINVNYKHCRLLMSGHYRASILPYIVTSSLFINHNVVILILKGLTNELLYAQEITFLIKYWSLGKLFLIAIEVTKWEVTTLQISNNTKLLRIHHPCWYTHTYTHTNNNKNWHFQSAKMWKLLKYEFERPHWITSHDIYILFLLPTTCDR